MEPIGKSTSGFLSAFYHNLDKEVVKLRDNVLVNEVARDRRFVIGFH